MLCTSELSTASEVSDESAVSVRDLPSRFGSDTPAWINVLSGIVERCRPSTDGAAEGEVTGSDWSDCKGLSRSTIAAKQLGLRRRRGRD